MNVSQGQGGDLAVVRTFREVVALFALLYFTLALLLAFQCDGFE